MNSVWSNGQEEQAQQSYDEAAGKRWKQCGGPPWLQQSWPFLNSVYMMPYMPVGLSRDLEEFGINHGYIPFGLGTIPCARRSPTPTSEAPTTSSEAPTTTSNPTRPNSTKPTTTKPTATTCRAKTQSCKKTSLCTNSVGCEGSLTCCCCTGLSCRSGFCK